MWGVGKWISGKGYYFYFLVLFLTWLRSSSKSTGYFENIEPVLLLCYFSVICDLD